VVEEKPWDWPNASIAGPSTHSVETFSPGRSIDSSFCEACSIGTSLRASGKRTEAETWLRRYEARLLAMEQTTDVIDALAKTRGLLGRARPNGP
jgi:hypothetical protein